MKAATFLCIATLIASAPTNAADVPGYSPSLGKQTLQGAIVCANYFQVKEAQTAAEAKDEAWLAQTGCARFRGGIRLTIIDNTTDIWRARLYVPERDAINVYLYSLYVVEFASAGKVKDEKDGEQLFSIMESRYRDIHDKEKRQKTLPHQVISNELFIGPAQGWQLHSFLTAKPRPGKADPAAFDKLIKNLEDKRPEPAAFDALLKNLPRQQVAQVEDTPPAPRRMAATAPPSSQPKAPLVSQLAARELDALREAVRQQLMPCWNVPAGARDAKDLLIEVRAAVNPDGTARQATIVDQGRLGDPLFRAAAESARRTFFNPACTPLKLPADKYEVWKNLVVGFNLKDIL